MPSKIAACLQTSALCPDGSTIAPMGIQVSKGKGATVRTWPETIQLALTKQSSEVLETLLVKRYLQDAKLAVKHSELLLNVLKEKPELTSSVSFDNVEVLTLDELVKSFEMLVPPDEAKLYGAVFTPSNITSFMAEETLTAARLQKTTTVLDPACGCGALLVAALQKIHHVTGEKPSNIIPQLIGVDISSQSLKRAKILLALTALTLGEDNKNYNYNLLAANSLTLNWAETYPEQDGKFDVILGNPPYVRYHHLPLKDRVSLSDNWMTLKCGSPNLYFAFFELANRLVKPEGIVCFITPNNFFATKSAQTLRGWLTTKGNLSRIIDFGDSRIFAALTYTTITFLNENDTPEIKYVNVANVEHLQHLDNNKYATFPKDILGEVPWQLTGKVDQAAIKKLNNAGRMLGDVSHIRYGIKTCRDRIYLVKGPANIDGYLSKEYLGKVWLIEESITVPHLVAPDIKTEDNIREDPQRIIYPYQLENGQAKIIDETTMQSVYPKCYEYLTAVKAELLMRDKGKKTYATWYAYARTQAIVPVAAKLVTPEYANKPRFMLDTRPSLYSNSCSVTERQNENGETLVPLAILQIILSSGIFHYYIDKTSTSIDGGYKSYQKSRLTSFTIPELSSEETSELLSLQEKGDLQGIDTFLAKKYDIVLPLKYCR